MKILINRGNVFNAKSYPFFDELINELKWRGHEIKEIKGILSEQEIIDLVNDCDVWITIDTFLQHLCAYYKLKKGIVIWGKSDPTIFGYPENINLLKDKKYLRVNQFRSWTDAWNDIENRPESFVSPLVVCQAIEGLV
jgi:ADP-heptose:LPS heptosyltransferase